MISIITGDIVNSRKLASAEWILGLKQLLNTLGQNPAQWEIYRGDEFQLEVANPSDALHHALLIKAYLKSIKLDARMSIGFGEKAMLLTKFPRVTELHLYVQENFLTL